MNNEDIQKIVSISEEAGRIIMKYFNNNFDVMKKEDDSPVTDADLAASKFIVERLEKEFPNIPSLSEESDEEVFNKRREWNKFFLIDPLDGTKEFVKRSGEFTVNIALIENNTPVMGVIHIPVTGETFYGNAEASFKKVGLDSHQLPLVEYVPGDLRVMLSKSHMNPETEAYMNNLKKKFNVVMDSVGSSIKICKVAEGSSDLNPRLGTGTKEWDIAAGHAILLGAGGDIHLLGTSERIPYNKRETLLNPEYEVKRKELLNLSLNGES